MCCKHKLSLNMMSNYIFGTHSVGINSARFLKNAYLYSEYLRCALVRAFHAQSLSVVELMFCEVSSVTNVSFIFFRSSILYFYHNLEDCNILFLQRVFMRLCNLFSQTTTAGESTKTNWIKRNLTKLTI